MGNVIGDDVSDLEDEQSVQGGTSNIPPRSSKKGKVAYNIYYGRTTVRSSAASQVKSFPGSVYEGFSNIPAAIAAWEYAVSNKTVGPHAGPPNTPRRQVHHNTMANTTTVVVPSTPSRQVTRTTPSTPTPLPTNLTTPTSPIASASSSNISSDPPSSRGSEAHLAAIVAVMDNLCITAYYVVVRGKVPGVYSTTFVVYTSSFSPLTSEISASALAALGTDPRGLCCLVAKKADADAMFVAQSMTGNIERLE
ncbi:uncharacterized protein LACBIDRAFT_323162 [Laccaria bicolor S238N-H82]|uniref:Predicted protein n=1 Tax=Laccaria bicolor (strain S238N-H82 / ATCC MYA-4686) TaxID=486041 RepID=B0CZB4_LACBS|nr:uncharacterized protein LACBIDRAFT_323162 [Laccaria bicolor S238N-H82]EDR12589.1 predicted protein [Laccaria bicolor S238N-H82]|eukprot:XP_001876853.1 predicted protein [Laccaria bicolor S238N-H82]